MPDTLKPCPFCGGKPLKFRLHCIGGSGNIYYTVECKSPRCPVELRTTVTKTKQEAIDAWNRRVGEEEKG